ncbi:MAG: 4Fe-4S dicluster domain-containing protein [Candidatus Omnitrophica bacterium]|nr:4Fe-4S dicluster domain-containing protein [Candidatus Omnitrophota bacterium]
MRYPKLRELAEAIRALIQGPYTTKFPFKPHVPEKRFRGKPEYYKDQCVGCGACSEVCPAGCIEMTDVVDGNPPLRKLTLHYDSCLFCGQCQANCITKEGIKLSNKLDDLSTFDRNDAIESVEKELVLCEACGCNIGAKDHLLWVAKKLGPLAYSSPTSYLSALKDLKLAYLKVEKSEDLTRQDRVKVLCPKCRREITLET